MRLAKDKIHMVVNLLCESSGIRSISRLTGLHQQTVLKILCLSGKLADQFQREKIKDLQCKVVTVDEIHTIVHGKDWGIKEKRSDWGSQYTFLSVDVESRLIINSNTGLRDTENAVGFFKTLKQRVPNRFQLNTDAWTGYAGRVKNSIKTVFGKEIDHATEEKEYYKLNQFVTRTLARTRRKSRSGNPDLELGSTSRVERTNLNLRLFNRRFTRCTLGYSKKLLNLRHSMALFCWYQNFARKHTTLRTTPAIAIGISTVIMKACDLWAEQSSGA
jgi:IS1 family transposase